MIHCPGCGQGLRFDIASQQMVCDYCDGRYDPASTASINKEANTVLTFESYVFSCPSCGGELLTTDETDAIGFCPFCGGASMIFDRIHQQWEPESIIPFKITKEQCKELYLKEAKRSFFTSNRYRDPQLIEGFRGIYMPYWNYQAVMKGDFSLYYETSTATSVREFCVKGEIDQAVEGYGHDASRAFDDRISEHIAPFDPRDHKPFAPGYLSGFYADIGDVDEHEYDQKALSVIRADTANFLVQDPAVIGITGGNGVKADQGMTYLPLKLKSAKRALYPVWFMSYRDKQDKLTYAAVNGQTGKVSADLPVSPLKILLTILLTGAAIAAALFLLPSVKANVTLWFTSGLLFLGLIILKSSFDNTVNKKTGLIDTPEAQRFMKHDTWRTLLLVLLIIAGVIVGFVDLAFNWITYLCCLIQAGALFFSMICHIRFQAEIAKRRPPQFEKKGAAYDEN